MAPFCSSPPPSVLNLRTKNFLRPDTAPQTVMSMTHTGAFFRGTKQREEPAYKNKPAFDAVVLKLQGDFFPKRVRVKEIFTDFDRLNRGEVSSHQFVRCLRIIMPGLKTSDWDALLSYCELPSGMIRYQILLDAIEEVFTTKNLYNTPCANVPKPGAQVTKNSQAKLPAIAASPSPNSQSPNTNAGKKPDSPFTDEKKNYGSPDVTMKSPDAASCSPLSPSKSGIKFDAGVDDMEAILHRVSLLAKTRGIVWKYCFSDFERTECASMVMTRRAGKITESQFRRGFPLNKDFSAAEIDMIVERYKSIQPDGTVLVDFMAMHHEVTSPEDIKLDAPIPTSHYTQPRYMLNDEWSSTKFSILERITAKVIELRVRLLDYFLDFDPLRRGYCTSKQFDTVFGILGLNMFTPREITELKGKYAKQDLNLTLFHYAGFCRDVMSATHYLDIHLDPLAVHKYDSRKATMPCRRSKLKLTEAELEQIYEMEENIKAIVGKRRMVLINNFRDFDRSNQGHVTQSQFGRVLQTLNIAGDPTKIDETLSLFAKKYGDLGCRRYLNYREFVARVDPPSDILKEAEQQGKRPYEKPTASQYFVEGGKTKITKAW